MHATAQYLTDQARPSHPALLEAYQHESAAAVTELQPARDVRYGPGPREVFDFFAGHGDWRGTLAYFHAGYWQARDKSGFQFLARAFLPHGIDVAMVNYPLCPEVTLPELVEATRRSVSAVLAHANGLGRGGEQLVASGHSAGGHIAVELALTGWGPALPIAGVAALSGVYDLVPLLDTPLNVKLRLDETTARAASPLHRVRTGMPPALFAVGGTETAAFRDQNAAMAQAWQQHGNPATVLEVAGEDHFSLLRALARPGALQTAVLSLF